LSNITLTTFSDILFIRTLQWSVVILKLIAMLKIFLLTVGRFTDWRWDWFIYSLIGLLISWLI